ncbi:VOC family protein [Bacillus sp. NTK071]|uniref:VOC family protein n=1 Tax=Bacillus sp. NTK071 TaxID=2802175 RepID=UPI001A8F5B1A|nr:VOC family protein [Bacillus sp. NTK071]MBN8209087.1 VOC family protein [Bacillus sp. NTK071]
MGFQSDQLFVNLPVKNLKETVDFFTKIGFEFNPQFTDDNATCMIINENTFVMLLVEEFFKTFTHKEITDATTNAEAIFAISANSREQVDEIVKKALEAGGKESTEPIDHGFMYGWSFQDINNHLWEVMYMDESRAQQA